MRKHIERKRIGQALFVGVATMALAVLAKVTMPVVSTEQNVSLGVVVDGEEEKVFPDIVISHEEELVISGVEDTYEFLVLADLHLVINESEDAGVYGDASERIAFFSNAEGTPSAEHLPQWVEYANLQEVDAVLMDGDMIDYYTEETAEYLCDNIAQLNMPYLFTLGNHELFSPWGETIPSDSELYSLFQDENVTFQKIEFEEFRICVIDNNEYQVNPASYVAMKAEIEADSEKPIILLAHVPFYTENDKELLTKSVGAWGQALVIGTGEGTRDTTSISRDFLDLILADESPVVAVFTGDNHFYHKGELAEGVTQWVIEPSFAGNGMILRVKGN